MPAGFDSADAFREWFDGPSEVAERLWRDLKAEAAHDHGDAEALKEAIAQGSGYIADVGVEILSGVDVPAIDSQMLTLKSETGDVWGGERDVLLKADDDEDRRISYAAAMIPREPDKEGDVVSTPQVERAAHNYLKSLQGDTDGTGVDTDHNLIDDKGVVVESSILDEPREYELPDGTTKNHEPGTWIVGIEWEPETWQRVKAGDIEGLSIYGMAEQMPLEREATAKEFVVPFGDESVVQVLYASRSVAAKAAERMGFEGDPEEITHEHPFSGDPHYMPAPSHDEYVDAYNEFAEADGFGPIDDGGEMVEASADDLRKEDPCWDGYTMVGTDENGDPRCVPDDDVPDAEGFENAVSMNGSGPPEGGRTTADDGQTVKDDSGESTTQNAMSDSTDDDTGGGEGVDTDELKADIIEEVKDDLADSEAGANTESEAKEERSVDELVAEMAEQLGDHDEVEADVMDIRESLMSMLKENDGMGDDEEDDEMEQSAAEKRAEESAAVKGYSGEGVRQAEAQGGDDAVDGNPLASREQAAKSWEGS